MSASTILPFTGEAGSVDTVIFTRQVKNSFLGKRDLFDSAQEFSQALAAELVSHLKGTTYGWYTGLDDEVVDDFERLSSALVERFPRRPRVAEAVNEEDDLVMPIAHVNYQEVVLRAFNEVNSADVDAVGDKRSADEAGLDDAVISGDEPRVVTKPVSRPVKTARPRRSPDETELDDAVASGDKPQMVTKSVSRTVEGTTKKERVPRPKRRLLEPSTVKRAVRKKKLPRQAPIAEESRAEEPPPAQNNKKVRVQLAEGCVNSVTLPVVGGVSEEIRRAASEIMPNFYTTVVVNLIDRGRESALKQVLIDAGAMANLIPEWVAEKI
ncbi:hypothetical protein ABEF95_015664 [Exophiala dermatitidis]